jgi:hypothetical protein
MLASQRQGELRHHVVLAVLHRVTGLATRGVHLGDDRALESALGRIARMRGLVSDAVADAAADASYLIFERPRIERLAERTSKQLEVWLGEAESKPEAPPEDVLLHLADAPRHVFERVGRWLGDPDPRRRAIAVAAYLRRLYSPRVPSRHLSSLGGEGWFDRFEFSGGRTVLGATCAPAQLVGRAERLLGVATGELDAGDWPPVEAIELFVPIEDEAGIDALLRPLKPLVPGDESPGRLTVTAVTPEGECLHRTYTVSSAGLRPAEAYHGIHPETAHRVDLDRLDGFELERIPSTENVYCFHGHSRVVPSDERIFVLADARSRSPDDGREAALHVPAFEHAFYEATRALRTILRLRDPKRRLHWNRIAVFVSPAIYLDPDIAQTLSRRLAPATRNLGLEKVVVRLEILHRSAPEHPPEPVEFVISDITGSNMEIRRRDPHTAPLEPSSDRRGAAGSSTPTRSSGCSPAAGGDARPPVWGPAGSFRWGASRSSTWTPRAGR